MESTSSTIFFAQIAVMIARSLQIMGFLSRSDVHGLTINECSAILDDIGCRSAKEVEAQGEQMQVK